MCAPTAWRSPQDAQPRITVGHLVRRTASREQACDRVPVEHQRVGHSSSRRPEPLGADRGRLVPERDELIRDRLDERRRPADVDLRTLGGRRARPRSASRRPRGARSRPTPPGDARERVRDLERDSPASRARRGRAGRRAAPRARSRASTLLRARGAVAQHRHQRHHPRSRRRRAATVRRPRRSR